MANSSGKRYQTDGKGGTSNEKAVVKSGAYPQAAITNLVEPVVAKYTLNEGKCVSKKLRACKRDDFEIEWKTLCANVIFNTASYEIFRRAAVSYYRTSPDYVIEGNPLLDQASNVAQETVRVHNKQKRNNPLVYTLNLYHTKSSLMVNGPHYVRFTNQDLPEIIEIIQRRDDDIKLINQKIEQSLMQVKENKLLLQACKEHDVKTTELQEVSSLEKDMELAMSMSLKLSKERVEKCQFCNKIVGDKEELTIHTINCEVVNAKPEIIKENSRDELGANATEHFTENQSNGNEDIYLINVSNQVEQHDKKGEKKEEENTDQGKSNESTSLESGNETRKMGRIPGNATGEHEITWQCLEEQEEEINVKLLSNSPSAVRSRRKRPPSWKVRKNLENTKREGNKNVHKKGNTNGGSQKEQTETEKSLSTITAEDNRRTKEGKPNM